MPARYTHAITKPERAKSDSRKGAMERKRGVGCGFLLLTLISMLILGTAWVYTTWRSSQSVLPSGLTINGLNVGGMTRRQALATVEQAYTRPISVTYGGEPIPPLLPEVVELRVDMDATAQNLDAALERLGQNESLTAFLNYIVSQLSGQKPEAIQVPAVVLYSRERVDAYLQRVAQKYDHPPLKAVALPEARTFRPPTKGTHLNVEASLPLLIRALLAADPAARHVDLVVETEPAPEASPEILREAWALTLADFGGIPGIFGKNLENGQEVCLNCDVAFAGLSTMKIAIATEIYRRHELPLDPQLSAAMKGMLTESDNAAANRLLADIGSGDPYTGALAVTDLLRSLGLRNSFIAAPYDMKQGLPDPQIATPANSQKALNTDPDPYIQTTPTDLGLLLEGLYQCTHGGGLLRALYPHEITPAECEELITWMTHNEINALLSQGMPPGTRVAHKHGWRGDTHADAAIVYGPEVDFVIVAFLYQPEWLVWEESVPTFTAIGSLAYRFFNGVTASSSTP